MKCRREAEVVKADAAFDAGKGYWRGGGQRGSESSEEQMSHHLRSIICVQSGPDLGVELCGRKPPEQEMRSFASFAATGAEILPRIMARPAVKNQLESSNIWAPFLVFNTRNRT